MRIQTLTSKCGMGIASGSQMDLKRIVEGHRTEIIRCLMIYGVCPGVFLVIQIFTGAVPVLFLLVAPIVMAVVVMFALNKFGNAFGEGFYGGRRIRLSIDEMVRGDLDKIRFSKRNGHFDEALKITNDLLKKVPDYPEALFLKAQIHHEAYGHHESAQKYLRKIIDSAPGDKEVHRWAVNYLKQIPPAANERVK